MRTVFHAVWAWFCAGMLACAGSAHAQATRVADLGISATLTPSGRLAPGSTARLTLTFTNNGPETAPAVGGVSSAYPFLEFERFALVPALPNPCDMHFTDFLAPPGSGQPSFLVAVVRAGSLSSGASRVCTLDLVVAPDATGTFDLNFFVNDGQFFISDANSANNNVNLHLVFAADGPTPIPAMGWPAAWWLLAGLALTGMLAAARHSAGRQQACRRRCKTDPPCRFKTDPGERRPRAVAVGG